MFFRLKSAKGNLCNVLCLTKRCASCLIDHKWVVITLVAALYLVIECVFCMLLKNDSVQSFLITIGEQIRGRTLNHAHWHNLFTNAPRFFLARTFLTTLFLCALFLVYSISKECRLSANCENSCDNMIIIIVGLVALGFSLLSIDDGQNWGGTFRNT